MMQRLSSMRLRLDAIEKQKAMLLELQQKTPHGLEQFKTQSHYRLQAGDLDQVLKSAANEQEF